MTAKSLKVAALPPVGLSGAAYLYGYARAWARRAERIEDPAFARFVRRDLRGRVLDRLRSLLDLRRRGLLHGTGQAPS